MIWFYYRKSPIFPAMLGSLAKIKALDGSLASACPRHISCWQNTHRLNSCPPGDEIFVAKAMLRLTRANN
jgi:hypothetical protein